MPDFPETSLSLIARVKDPADGASWVEFLRIYQPVVYRMARRRGLQDADAQDVMQQVFSSISRAIDGWTPGNDQPPFRAWLTTIARNTITKALTRKPRDRASGSTSVVELLNAMPGPDETTAEILVETRREIVRRAAEQVRANFTAETWEMFRQTSIEGVSVSKVAEELGRSAGSVYVARHRVLTRLKETVAEFSQQWDVEENRGGK